MPNYKESSIAGTSWTRASNITIDNSYGLVPSITFTEEEVFSIGDEFITKTKPITGILRQRFTDPLQTFSLLDPVTDQYVGEVSHGQVYAMIYSLYQHLAKARDVAEAAALVAPTPAPVVAPVVAPIPVP